MNLAEPIRKESREIAEARLIAEKKAQKKLAKDGPIMSWLEGQYVEARGYAKEYASRGAPGAGYFIGRADQLEDIMKYLISLKPAKG